MDLASVVDELYGLPPQDFTTSRDERSSEARSVGDKDLAGSIKQLRKPTVGAWMANMLVRSQRADVDRLIDLGEALRSNRKLDGDQIRQVSKEKNDAVTSLIRQGRSMAKRAGQPVSQAAELDLEATLDASFADPVSAAALLAGCLTSALHYSGLGLGSGMKRIAPAPDPRSSRLGNSGKSPLTPGQRARRALEDANRESKVAEAEVEKAMRAVTAAEADLKRTKASLAVATRRSARAREKSIAAKRKIDSLRRKAR